jgi:hypothetical protein
MKIRLFSIIFILSIFCSVSFGQIVQFLTFQTILTNEKGILINKHKCKVTFKIYEDETGGNPIWKETQRVTLKKGVLSVVLGRIEPFNFVFDRIYWLGISLKDDNELKPRRPLTTAAYSFTAMGVIGESNIFPSQGNVGIGVKDPKSKLEVDGMIHSASGGYQFPDGSVQTSAANLNSNSDSIIIKSRDKVIKIIAGNNAIILDPEKGLILECDNFTIQSKNEANISASNASINADNDVKIKGFNVSNEAQLKVDVKGMRIDVKSSGINTIQGAPVMIN